jgi:hypothetical protein
LTLDRLDSRSDSIWLAEAGTGMITDSPSNDNENAPPTGCCVNWMFCTSVTATQCAAVRMWRPVSSSVPVQLPRSTTPSYGHRFISHSSTPTAKKSQAGGDATLRSFALIDRATRTIAASSPTATYKPASCPCTRRSPSSPPSVSISSHPRPNGGITKTMKIKSDWSGAARNVDVPNGLFLTLSTVIWDCRAEIRKVRQR